MLRVINLIFSYLLRVMSIFDSIEGNIDSDVGFDVIEVFVLGSRLVSTGDLIICMYIVYHCMIP